MCDSSFVAPSLPLLCATSLLAACASALLGGPLECGVDTVKARAPNAETVYVGHICNCFTPPIHG